MSPRHPPTSLCLSGAEEAAPAYPAPSSKQDPAFQNLRSPTHCGHQPLAHAGIPCLQAAPTPQLCWRHSQRTIQKLQGAGKRSVGLWEALPQSPHTARRLDRRQLSSRAGAGAPTGTAWSLPAAGRRPSSSLPLPSGLMSLLGGSSTNPVPPLEGRPFPWFVFCYFAAARDRKKSREGRQEKHLQASVAGGGGVEGSNPDPCALGA